MVEPNPLEQFHSSLTDVMRSGDLALAELLFACGADLFHGFLKGLRW